MAPAQLYLDGALACEFRRDDRFPLPLQVRYLLQARGVDRATATVVDGEERLEVAPAPLEQYWDTPCSVYIDGRLAGKTRLRWWHQQEKHLSRLGRGRGRVAHDLAEATAGSSPRVENLPPSLTLGPETLRQHEGDYMAVFHGDAEVARIPVTSPAKVQIFHRFSDNTSYEETSERLADFVLRSGARPTRVTFGDSSRRYDMDLCWLDRAIKDAEEYECLVLEGDVVIDVTTRRRALERLRELRAANPNAGPYKARIYCGFFGGYYYGPDPEAPASELETRSSNELS
jgi:hypothetical protein